ncbi:MAG: M55 family metallopeptidase [Phycisphaerae bacterium]|nr:M55 family metallopeptidase [Phycisphaerae bacterium]
MKVFMGTDLEGVAGVSTFMVQTSPDGRYYDDAKKLLTAEINAAVEGMLEAGVNDVLVCDGHGPGAVRFEDIHPAAKLLHGRPLAPRHVRDEIVKDYDVCIMLGQHAMAGVADGNLHHTQSSGTIEYYKLNGEEIGEIAQFALYHGAMGLPMIFLSGDHAACREAEELIPGVTTTCVKQGLSRNSAISLSAPESHRLIREGIKKAIENHKKNPVAPLVWDGPFVLDRKYFHTDTADAIASQPGVQRVDSQTVRFQSDDIRKIIY